MANHKLNLHRLDKRRIIACIAVIVMVYVSSTVINRSKRVNAVLSVCEILTYISFVLLLLNELYIVWIRKKNPIRYVFALLIVGLCVLIYVSYITSSIYTLNHYSVIYNYTNLQVDVAIHDSGYASTVVNAYAAYKSELEFIQNRNYSLIIGYILVFGLISLLMYYSMIYKKKHADSEQS
ncbi:MAG: hypothetical protein PHX51_04535 [Clostridia bacterium]|nr:hypothetical protein [Clostridia bacterium]